MLLSLAPQLTVNTLVQCNSLDQALQEVASVYDFRHHPYIIWMQHPSTSRHDFCQSQIPFRFAVESFSQALAAVLAHIPLLEARLPLAENIAEEHGHGDRLRSHKATFTQYLEALGATVVDLRSPCTVPVMAFNQSLLTYSLTQPGEAGATLLGVIEYLYVGISRTIAQTLQERQWTAPGSQFHYATHESLDVDHARDLLALAEPGWEESRSRLHIAQGLLLGAHYFWSLYRDLQPTL